jgi:hypothetical protein
VDWSDRGVQRGADGAQVRGFDRNWIQPCIKSNLLEESVLAMLADMALMTFADKGVKKGLHKIVFKAPFMQSYGNFPYDCINGASEENNVRNLTL